MPVNPDVAAMADILDPSRAALPPEADDPPPGVASNTSTGPEIAPADGSPRGKGRTVPRTAAAVSNAQDYLRIVKVNDLGQHIKIGDFAATEIGGAGDVDAYVLKYLAPKYGGGEFQVFKHGKGGQLVYLQNVLTPITVAPVVAPPAPPPPPGPTVNDAANLLHTVTKMQQEAAADAERRTREAADRARADAAADDARMDRMMALMRPPPGPNGQQPAPMDPITMMMMMRMLDKPAAPVGPPPADPRFDSVIQALQQLDQRINQVAMQAQQPPPMPYIPPPPPPVPTAFEQAQALAMAFGPLITPLIAGYAGQKSFADQLMEALPALAAAGVIGGEKVTAQDVAMAGVTAKLDMMMQQPPGPDPLEQMRSLSALMNELRPPVDNSAKDWIAVAEKAIDKAPELMREFAGFSAAQITGSGGGATTVKKVKTKAGTVIPKVLADLRAKVLAVPVDPNLDHKGTAADPNKADPSIPVIQLMIQGLGALAKAGKPWEPLVREAFDAATEDPPDVETMKLAFAKIITLAWGKNDEQSRVFFRKAVKAWTRYAAEVAVALRKSAAQARGETVEEEAVEEESSEGAADAADAATNGVDEAAADLAADPGDATAEA